MTISTHRGRRTTLAVITAATLTITLTTPLMAQDSAGDGGGGQGGSFRATPPSLEARKIDGQTLTIDGRLDESVWTDASVATNFVQFSPLEGGQPSQKTEARVLYGTDALYVGIKAFDNAPDSIVAQLARRDQNPYSDWVSVAVDSYHDQRTAFEFSVNPAGVKRDVYRFDDSDSDDSWNAVWDAATSRGADGWVAEFRIPYSQLRFDSDSDQTWGINFSREIARHQEENLWAPVTRAQAGVVSQFGDLTGLRDLQPPRRLEILPYSLVRLESVQGDLANPFYDPRAFGGKMGADVKYGITSNLTLDLTINPDFGQVEADPGEVNLSAFETFLSEQRPFFIEGANIFNFAFSGGDGDMASEGLFYSRRIGRPPHGRAPGGATYADVPRQANILGALKISGKTADGWSVGFMHAVTAKEEAQLADGSGSLDPFTVEPLTQYGVGRLQKDFRGGRSALGVISTWTNRDRETANALSLHTGAYTGGLDFRHRFASDNYAISGYALGTHVRGSAEALIRTQRSPARYFQNPDGDHVTFDPTRTTLNGWSGSANLAKVAGGYWRFSTGVLARSPGFEPNDVGFMRNTDMITPHLWVGYQHFRPTAYLRRWNLNVNGWSGHDFSGERRFGGGNVNGSVGFNNFWNAYAGVGRNLSGLGSGLRGGPLMIREGGYQGWTGFSTDSRKSLQVNVNSNFNTQPAADSWQLNGNANVQWRPSSRAQMSLGPFINRREQDLQWVRRIDLDKPNYVFARLDQTTMGFTARVDWTFSPTLSLQFYGQPFVSSGSYDGFKRITDPAASKYEDRFSTLGVSLADNTITTDVDGDGTVESFRAPDFTFAQFRSNAVLRWEYQPGSALFLVWSQGRNYSTRNGEFSLDDSLSSLFSQSTDNIFMLKLSYWLG